MRRFRLRRLTRRRRRFRWLDFAELDLALELAAQLRRGAPRATHPLADLRGDLRQLLRPEHEQADHEQQDELTKTDVEHA